MTTAWRAGSRRVALRAVGPRGLGEDALSSFGAFLMWLESYARSVGRFGEARALADFRDGSGDSSSALAAVRSLSARGDFPTQYASAASRFASALESQGPARDLSPAPESLAFRSTDPIPAGTPDLPFWERVWGRVLEDIEGSGAYKAAQEAGEFLSSGGGLVPAAKSFSEAWPDIQRYAKVAGLLGAGLLALLVLNVALPRS